MADEESPSWLSSAQPAASNAPAASTDSQSKASDSANPPYKTAVKGTFTFFNMGFMVFMAATGALGVGSATSINDTGTIFVGIYMIVFAAILFTFEVAQVCPCSMLDNFIKRNFGFLYGVIGKGLFILFMGILAFGLSSPASLALACGILVSAWGPLQIFIYMKWPDYFDKKEKYQP